MRLLPIDYAVRSLLRSKPRLMMSLFGSATVVLLVTAASAFVRGMEASLVQSGSSDNVILLGTGSEESVERSEISAAVPSQVAAAVPGIRTRLGMPLVSPEVHMALMVATGRDAAPVGQAVFRGVTPTAFAVHPQVRLIEGRVFNPGEDELIVGSLTHTRLGVPREALRVGASLWLDGREWRIVGRYAAPGTVMDAEVWCPLPALQILTRRDTLSCVVVTLDGATFADMETFALSRLDLELSALTEETYYRQLVAFYRPIRLMVWVTALLIALGGILGGLNTMYSAFAARAREVGMLQSLGYSRWAVVVSFVQESLLVAMAGGLLGSVVALVFLDGLAVRVSMGAFGLAVDGTVVAVGIVSGIVLGAVGSLPPAVRALGLPVAEALKAV
jgi:putative ABC transport system permease protein